MGFIRPMSSSNYATNSEIPAANGNSAVEGTSSILVPTLKSISCNGISVTALNLSINEIKISVILRGTLVHEIFCLFSGFPFAARCRP